MHLNHLRDTLLSQHGEDRLHVLVAKSNSNNDTYDGIEVGGERIVNEIETELVKLEENGNKIKKISIAGYSLGGLLSRYAVGLLFSRGIFDKIQPINFTTFASPHLGVRTPIKGYRSHMWNYMGARTLGTTGQQMFLVDSFRDTNRPLLSIMADPNSVFLKGLSLFKSRWFYSNTMNDRSVPYYTGAISRTDPFVNLDKIEVNYLPGQEVLLDPEDPVSLAEDQGDGTSAAGRRQVAPKRKLNNFSFYLILFSLMPIAVPVFLLNAGYQSFKSAQRVRLHESGKTMQLDRYRVKLLEESQAVQDRVYERLADRHTEEYLPTPPSEPSTLDESDEKALSRTESAKEKGPFPILALTKEQFAMIDNLSSIGITVFPVHIQQVRHTHAAIVVRIPKESFAEGKVVSAHWAKRFQI